MSEAREILLGSYWMTFGIFDANSLHPALIAREFKTFLYHRMIYKRSFTSYNFFFKISQEKKPEKMKSRTIRKQHFQFTSNCTVK